MKSRRPAPPPAFSLDRAQLLREPRVRTAIAAVKADPDYRPVDLDPERTALVMREARGHKTRGEYDRAYERAIRDLTPVLAAPDGEDPHDDLCLIMGLPEMQRFWAELDVPRAGTRGPKPSTAGAKATLMVLAMCGESAYLEDAYHSLARSPRLLQTFETLDRMAQGRVTPSLPGLGAAPAPLELTAYSSVARHARSLAENCIELARATRIELLRSLSDYVPGIGQHGMIDGCKVPAWAPQRAARRGDESMEARLRAHAPDAGYRLYTRKNGVKVDVPEDAQAANLLRTQVAKSWRGYFKVTITDVVSGGLPLVTSVFDAAQDEAPAMIPLLQDLQALWPDLAMQDLAADSAWDEDWACQHCLTHYGIHPLFRFHNDRGYRLIGSDYSRDGSIKALTAHGQMICAAHNQPLQHLGLEGAGRNGLEPGELNPKPMRVRGYCPAGCGRLGLNVTADPSKLLHHPHFLDDGPRTELNAYRQARLDLLNLQESYHQRLKGGFKLGTEGPERTRLRDLTTVTALMELADLAMVAMTVWDVRNQHGIPMHLAVPVSDRPEQADRQAA